MAKALLVVDLQNDFLPSGALPVKEGDAIIPVVNELMSLPFDFIVASKDWHPLSHHSFSENHPDTKVGDVIQLHGRDQILWPVHCVQESVGSAFAPGLAVDKIQMIIYKGTDPEVDSYSAFFDNDHVSSTGLENSLRQKGIDTVYIAGLATDYCVKYTVLDALKLGFNVAVIQDACRGVNIQPDDSARALDEMKKQGALIITADSLFQDRKETDR